MSTNIPWTQFLRGEQTLLVREEIVNTALFLCGLRSYFEAHCSSRQLFVDDRNAFRANILKPVSQRLGQIRNVLAYGPLVDNSTTNANAEDLACATAIGEAIATVSPPSWR